MSSIKINEEFFPETQYIIATLSTAVSIADATVPLDTIYNSNGDFSLSNKGIVIPSGVNKVRVSGSIFIDNPGNTGYLWGIIVLNDIRITGQILGTIRGNFESITIPSVILDVKEGDTIYLYLDNKSGQGTIRTSDLNTFLMVEEIR